jgi:hypothetical protein
MTAVAERRIARVRTACLFTSDPDTTRTTEHLMSAVFNRLPSPAMIVASLALVLALGGVSYAAGVLPANSVGAKQLKKRAVSLRKITPAARNALRGQKGAPGPAGTTGAVGPKGDTGPPGPFPGLLPSGKTVRGAYTLVGTAAAAGTLATDSISFGFVLAAPPTDHFIPVAGPANAGCPGTAAAPEASPGHLCVYEAKRINAAVPATIDPVTGTGTSGSVRAYGAAVLTKSIAGGLFFSGGSWAVTAP